MRILADFMKRFDFVKMAAADDVLSGDLSGLRARALVEQGRQYAVYVSVSDAGPAGTLAERQRALGTTTFPSREIDLVVALPPGRYGAEWIGTTTGQPAGRARFDHAGGARTLHSPAFTTDVALRIVATGQ